MSSKDQVLQALERLISLVDSRKYKSNMLYEASFGKGDQKEDKGMIGLVCGYIETIEKKAGHFNYSAHLKSSLMRDYESSLGDFRKGLKSLNELAKFYLSNDSNLSKMLENLQLQEEPSQDVQKSIQRAIELLKEAEQETLSYKLFDREAAKNIWDGKVPVIFNVHQADLEDPSNQPELAYMMVSRCSYFHLIAKDVVQDFQRYVKKSDQDFVWFEFKNTPLKTHIPIGVLYDLLANNSPLPWRVTIHFKNFPYSFIPLIKPEEGEHFFFSSMKQSETIKTGGIKRVMSLSKINQAQLWESLISRNFDKFWEVNSDLLQGENGQPIKAIPFKIYLPNSVVCMKNIPPTDQNGKEKTLGDILTTCLPEIFKEGKKPTILIHGISPPLSAPALWLSSNFSCQDNILHIVVHP